MEQGNKKEISNEGDLGSEKYHTSGITKISEKNMKRRLKVLNTIRYSRNVAFISIPDELAYHLGLYRRLTKDHNSVSG